MVALIGYSLSARSRAAQAAGRELNFEIDAPGFPDASPADIEAVLRSAAESIWRYCPNTRWKVPGFYIYHTEHAPIVLDEHRADGRIAVGLTPTGTYWAQFAFQFAHEFCHALAGHSNDWHKPWIGVRKANQWLEESLCETASLFALQAMGKSWETQPPYPNWKDFAPHLTEYAQDRLDKARTELSKHTSFAEWFAQNEPAMRQKAELREKNLVVASRLLPLFEAHLQGWEAMTFYNLGPRKADESLADRFADWGATVPAGQRKFVGSLAAVFRA